MLARMLILTTVMKMLILATMIFQLSDLLFILLCVPFTAADYALTSVWPFGDLWCSSVQYFIIVTVLVSIYTLVLMSLDRWGERMFCSVLFVVSFLGGGNVESLIKTQSLLGRLARLASNNKNTFCKITEYK